jgi:pimeloyl-ACP methyl ester carboxylesterase
VPSRNGAAVVLAHGAGSTRSAVLDHAAVIARHGYGVLLYDARGHGRSGGHAMDFGWYGDADVSAAVSYLARRPGVDASRIAAVGLSMGGEEAIGAAASDRRIAAVVAEGATTRVPADKAWLPYDAVGLVKRGEAWVTYSVAGLLTDAERPMPLHDAVRAVAPRPVLLVEGAQEDEIATGRALRAASPANVELWPLPDTAHTKGLRTHPGEWERRVVGFLDAALSR